jgi:hypothetical protein
MSKADTAPAAETENAEPASIADLVAERHQALPDHEAHKEVGEDPDDEPAPAAAPAAKTAPAPVAEAAPAAKVETPVDPATKPEPNSPSGIGRRSRRSARPGKPPRPRTRTRSGPASRPNSGRRPPASRTTPTGRSPARSWKPTASMTRWSAAWSGQRNASSTSSARRPSRSHPRMASHPARHRGVGAEAARPWALGSQPVPQGRARRGDRRRPQRLARSERERIRQELLAEMAPRVPAPAGPPRSPADAVRTARPASTARSAAPRDEAAGSRPPRSALTKNKFGSRRPHTPKPAPSR